MRTLVLLFILFFNSCFAPKQEVINQNLAFGSYFGSFAMDAPKKWTKIKVQGIDSYVGHIEIDTKDTIEFDLGYYSYDLTESEPEDFNGDNSSKYTKTKISFDRINGYITDRCRTRGKNENFNW